MGHLELDNLVTAVRSWTVDGSLVTCYLVGQQVGQQRSVK